MATSGLRLAQAVGEQINQFSELRVYREAFKLQQSIFRWSRTLPPGERYALRDQVLRSSRSVGANLAEAWQKRRYPAHFISKLSDADAELAETRHWIYTASSCGYLSAATRATMIEHAESVGRMIGSMMNAPRHWCR